MTLQILDGQLQSTLIPLQQNYTFSGTYFQDTEMKTEHAKVLFDHNFNWKINGLGGFKIRISHDEVDSISLIPGLIFHLGQTGFKVVERAHPDASAWEQVAADFVNNLNISSEPSNEVFFFLSPVQITFLQGPQSGDIFTLSYGPRILGSNHLDLNLKDPTQPHELLRFEQVGDKVLIKNLSDEKSVLVNKNAFTEYILSGANRFTFGTNIIEISILK